ncbi:fungal specific transcription factor domain-containing protein [Seiridium cupressi]
MDDDRLPPCEQPPLKRQRVLACRRCRHRKQKCDDLRPCTNCQKSGDECIPTEPAPRSHVESQYVKALEERIAELESLDPQQSLDHMRASVQGQQRRTSSNSAVSCQVQPSDRQSTNGVSSIGASRPRTTSVPDTDLSVVEDNDVISTRTGPRTRLLSYTEDLSRRSIWTNKDEPDTGFDHLIFGLIASPSIPRDVNSEPSVAGQDEVPIGKLPTSQFSEVDISSEVKELLLQTYRERAQVQYPFLHWDTFLTWHASWVESSVSPSKSRWQGFFVNLAYATALLLLHGSPASKLDAQMFYRNGVALLPSVLAQEDPVLHVQAYLLLSVHALHKSSSGRILTLASTTMRYCVQQQFHLAETELDPITPAIRLGNQMRRRCFWCAYKLDRLVMSSFDLPPSIPDAMITLKIYNNIEDHDLLQVASETPQDSELPDASNYTCVSSSLHIVQCRRIQSEIMAFTLRWDYAMRFEKSPEWRIRILAELENYRSRVQKFSDPHSKGYTSNRWLAMIYHYTLLMLYRPTKETVLGPAGDWSVQASSQACLIFRKTQMDRQIAQSWLGLLVQFQSGITLLYCFWATPPANRTENYDSPDVSDAIRACSNILAIMADRWPRADCLRDVFELIAREIPLVDRPNRPPKRLSERSIVTIREKLPQVRALIVHRPILRMIEEMTSSDFPRPGPAEPLPRPPSVPGLLAPIHRNREDILAAQANQPSTMTPPTMLSFELPFSTEPMYNFEGMGTEAENTGTEELLSFPGMFDYETWQ